MGVGARLKIRVATPRGSRDIHTTVSTAAVMARRCNRKWAWETPRPSGDRGDVAGVGNQTDIPIRRDGPNVRTGEGDAAVTPLRRTRFALH